MVKMHHPDTGAETEVPEKTARVMEKSGWVRDDAKKPSKPATVNKEEERNG